ncbi:MAG: hypothetical protein KAG98_05355 [Lentisphaeria bacterium]|nr:hypothetical protein [Lentisphaeria bacterium]
MKKIILLLLLSSFSLWAKPFASLSPKESKAGYLARLLINETPFPGERGWKSQKDTKYAMLAILWVLHSRIHHIPDGYLQRHVSAVTTNNIVDVITVGGEKGQCDGFYRNANGKHVAVPRVEERVDYLMMIANKGKKPGRFANLLNYAQGLAIAYTQGSLKGADRFVGLHKVHMVYVTGRAYSWMTNVGFHSPGGNFIRITDFYGGALGGNRFFTLKKLN